MASYSVQLDASQRHTHPNLAWVVVPRVEIPVLRGPRVARSEPGAAFCRHQLAKTVDAWGHAVLAHEIGVNLPQSELPFLGGTKARRALR